MARLSPAEKRYRASRAKLLALLKQFPGILAGNIPKGQRRFLRFMELEGLIEYKGEYKKEGWFIK